MSLHAFAFVSFYRVLFYHVDTNIASVSGNLVFDVSVFVSRADRMAVWERSPRVNGWDKTEDSVVT